MNDLLVTVLTACHAAIESQGPTLGGLFLTGLVGSLIHCGPMCGPLVLAQVGARIAPLPAGPGADARRLRLGLLGPYHLGRGITYAGLGAMAAGTAGLAEQAAGLRGLGAMLLGLAALGLLAMALGGRSAAGPGALGQRLARLAAPLIGAPRAGRGLLLGLLLGFLPCGLLFAALAAAASAGTAAGGALGMAAFWAGTVPMLVAVGLLGQALWQRLRRRFAAATRWLLGGNALVLAGLAIHLAGSAPAPVTFTLLGEGGRTVTEADFPGRALLIYFGYTYCPDVCPTSLATLAATLDRLPAATRARLVPLFVTIDPGRDDSERAAAYARVFDPRLVGLSGRPEEISRLTRRFGVPVARVEGADPDSYTLDHGSLFHLVGADRRLIARFADRPDPAALAAQIAARIDPP